MKKPILNRVSVVFFIQLGLNSYGQKGKLKLPKVYYGDITPRGVPFAKYSQVIKIMKFRNR